MTRIAPRRRRAASLGLLLLAATACAEASTPSTTPAPTTSPTEVSASADVSASASPFVVDIWMAALRVEADPNALDADTRDLKDVLGGALLVSPAGCFLGLPPEVDASAYVLGIQAPTQTALDTLVAKSEREPVFEGQVQMLCTD